MTAKSHTAIVTSEKQIPIVRKILHEEQNVSVEFISREPNMTTLILIFLILIASLIGAYTMNFQETTLSIGRKLAPNNELLPAGLQDAITSKGQTLRNIIYPFLTLVIFVYGLIFYNWYFALGFTVLTFFIITPILKFVLPKIESDYYKQKIKNNLLKRQSHYRSIGDTDSEMAIKEVLTRFNKLD